MATMQRLMTRTAPRLFERSSFLGAATESRVFLRSAGAPRFFSSYPPHELVGLPALSPTMETGSIAAWNLSEGDSFSAGDVFCSVETDKATVDMEAQDDGVLAKILAVAGPGDLKVGDPIMITVENPDDAGAFKDYVVAEAAAAPPAPAAPEPAAAPPAPAAAPAPAPSSAPAATGDRIVASPKAFKMAKEKALDLSQVIGTGPGGRILAADVVEFVPTDSVATSSEPAPAQVAMATAAPVPGEGYTDYPLSQHAVEVAARLAQAKRNVPHYYLTVDISCDELLKLRSTLNSSGANDLGTYELFVKAAAAAMKTVPSVNASWMESVVRVFDSVDINVVVGSGDSLYTPVLESVNTKGVSAISQELATAVSVLDDEEESTVVGGVGTFTIMNLGMYGIKSCAPIIREPQACALALGALENRIVPNDDADSDEIYKEAVMMTATLSCDHRVVDGAVGAQWLAAFKSHVESPTTLLL